jgi:probable HAF family extracellular repeat protein
MTDLNSPIATNSGWLLKVAAAINDNGQIVGWGVNPSGEIHAFLLTPLPSLDIACSGLNVILSWPTNATGFALVENSDLATTNWGAVMIAPIVTNGQNQVFLSTLPASSRFYRLQSP